MMDTQTVINIAVGIIIAGMGWFARAVWDAVQNLQNDLHQLECDLPVHYVRKDEFADKIHNVKNAIYQNIYNNLSYIYKSKGTEKSTGFGSCKIL